MELAAVTAAFVPAHPVVRHAVSNHLRDAGSQGNETDRRPAHFGLTWPGTSFSRLAGHRDLDSELLLLWLAGDTSWIAVDGVPRAPGDRHVQTTLNGPPVSIGQLRQLATANGRFNIGEIVHTFSEPTLALLMLDAHYQPRLSFQRSTAEVIGRRRTSIFAFGRADAAHSDPRQRPGCARTRQAVGR